MACRRMLSKQIKQGTLFQRCYHPSLSHIVHRGDKSDENSQSPYPSPLSQLECGISNNVLSHIHNGSNIGGNGGFRAHFGWNKRFPVVILPESVVPSLSRKISSAAGEGFDNAQPHGDNITSILTSENVEVVSSQVPAINEVAVAAADSAFPIAALQYLIDAVQTLTGLNWWAAIAITTLMVEGSTIPFAINEIRAAYKRKLLRLEELKKKWHLGKVSKSEILKEWNVIRNQLEVYPKLTLIRGSISISFFFAISNMVEKVPSLKYGGAFWFTDLTTPDSLYICPVLTVLLFLAHTECNMLRSLKGHPSAGDFKRCSRTFAILAVPLTMDFSKAFFCYLITSRLFMLSRGTAQG
ncbi:mitochondrial inner membrane protein OXA1-like isoform X2 [Chenopodium quinoa]|uniref:mitochondrial inner membrane protein OXA1-like isoform X2 n=1 Tax=Chenopodium quinoa TaxID=63459 RepID=UPI000B78F07F|nr:mitochondrial inner membrane protein OXA1-like isoform X2 [Chenopodium quinoa]